MTPALPQLTYAAAPAWHRRKRVRRTVWFAVLAIAAACFLRWHKPLIEHAQVLYWQQACAGYVMGPDTTVASIGHPLHVITTPIPDAWANYERVSYVATLARPVSANRSLPQTLAFLHARTSPGGNRRIVAVRCVSIYLSSASVLQAFQPAVVRKVGLWPLSSHPIRIDGHFAGGYPIDVDVTVLGGQADPADSSHFTIAYTVNNRPGTIDGWLRDDDAVKLQTRLGDPDVMAAYRASHEPK
jgi:hypothetical protein